MTLDASAQDTARPRVHLRPVLATLPAYVPGARANDPNVAKLSSNEMPYPPDPAVLDALTQAAAEGHRYPEMTGSTLVEEIARWHGCEAHNVVVGGGSVALIQHLLDTVCDDGDDVVLPWRSFEAYPICIAIAGANARTVPLTADGRHDVDGLIAALTPRTRLLMLCSPNNPTGTSLSRAELDAIMTAVPDDVVVLADEAYIDFVTDPHAANAMDIRGRYPNLVVSRTFSKAHALAGLRVGYLIGDPALMVAVRSVATPFGVNLPAQAAAIAAIDPQVRHRTAARVATVVAQREQVITRLHDDGWAMPDAQGNFFWLGVGQATTDLAEHLRAHGILARPFAGEGVRVSIGVPDDNERVLNALHLWDGPRG